MTARRRSKPEEEKDAGKPVEPTEPTPEPDTSEQFGEKRIDSMPADDPSGHFHEIDENDPFYVAPFDTPEGSSSVRIESIDIPHTGAIEPMPSKLRE